MKKHDRDARESTDDEDRFGPLLADLRSRYNAPVTYSAALRTASRHRTVSPRTAISLVVASTALAVAGGAVLLDFGQRHDGENGSVAADGTVQARNCVTQPVDEPASPAAGIHPDAAAYAAEFGVSLEEASETLYRQASGIDPPHAVRANFPASFAYSTELDDQLTIHLVGPADLDAVCELLGRTPASQAQVSVVSDGVIAETRIAELTEALVVPDSLRSEVVGIFFDPVTTTLEVQMMGEDTEQRSQSATQQLAQSVAELGDRFDIEGLRVNVTISDSYFGDM